MDQIKYLIPDQFRKNMKDTVAMPTEFNIDNQPVKYNITGAKYTQHGYITSQRLTNGT